MKLFAAILAISLSAAEAAGDAKQSSNLRGDVDLESPARRSLVETRSRCDTLANCDLVTGSYRASEGLEGSYLSYQEVEIERDWWAFKPDNCPDEGCPLFFWIDGTGERDYQYDRQQAWMEEMFNRGYVAVTVDYASSAVKFAGCYGRFLGDGSWGVDDKAKSIFDRDSSHSVTSKLCGEHANCDLGIAVGGFSQGSLIVGLASEYDDRVSAALLYGSGNLPGYLEFTLAGIRDMQCMNTVKLAKQRRRYFSGDNDRLFGGDYDGTRTQLAEISHYKCDSNGGAGDDNCLHHPESNSEVPDPYTGGTIENTGGYYIVKNGVHGQFLEWPCFYDPDHDHGLPYYRETNLDWLDTTARATKPHLDEDEKRVTLEMDLEHWRLTGERAPDGIFFEWAARVNSRGTLGRRWIVAEDTSSFEKTFDRVPKDVVGFRLTARTYDAAFIDQVHVKDRWGTFKNLSFDRDRYDGYCLSRDPERDFARCHGNKSYKCIDFCTNGQWYDCHDGVANREFSLCP